MEAASGSGEVEDKRWSLEGEILNVLNRAVFDSFPDEDEEPTCFENVEKWVHSDCTCLNVLTIWPKIRKDPELRKKYSRIKVPKQIGEEIKDNLLAFAPSDMIQKSSIHGVGVVAFSLSRKWLAQSIHKMLKDGIDTWAPILPVERVLVVDFPTLHEEIDLGWFRQRAIINTLTLMLVYSKAEVHYSPNDFKNGGNAHCFSEEWDSHFSIELEDGVEEFPWKTMWNSQIKIDQRDRDMVIYVGEKPPFILAKEDFHTFYELLKTLWWGSKELSADWIVLVAPLRQQEFIGMCFTAAKLEGSIKTNMEGKWSPSFGVEYPLLTYAGYRACSTKQEEFDNLLQDVKARCDVVAQGKDAKLLRYTAEAIFSCVFRYTCLKNHRLADCTFNLDEMVNEEGNNFVCLLRIRAEVHTITNASRGDIDELKKASDLILEKYEGCEEGKEHMLELHLLKFTEALKESSLYLSLHVMCEYLYDLSMKFKSFIDFVLMTGFAKTSGLLLCEATEVVMEKCFHLLGITPEVTTDVGYYMKHKMAEREQMDETHGISVDPSLSRLWVERPQEGLRGSSNSGSNFADCFITPCIVSDARDPCRNSRFEVFSFHPSILTDPKFKGGYLFGLITVADRYGLRSGGGYTLYEPGVSYIPLFDHEWCDPIEIRNSEVIYVDSSYHSVPFSSSIEIQMELYASTKEEDTCYQICDKLLEIDLKDIWTTKSNSRCGCVEFKGEDGRTLMYYALIKDAVDVAIDIDLEVDAGSNCGSEMHGHIFAFYGDEFPYIDDCHFTKVCYQALLFYGRMSLTSGIITPKRSMLAVPKGVTLRIQVYFEDLVTGECIFLGKPKFKLPNEKGGSKVRNLSGEGCCMKLKVTRK